MPDKLSVGALQLIPVTNEEINTNPITVQITEIKRLRPDESSPTRIKLTIFDGVISLTCIVADSICNKFFPEGETQRTSIIKLKRYICRNLDRNGKVLVVIDFDELQRSNSVEIVQDENINGQLINEIDNTQEHEQILPAVPTERTPPRAVASHQAPTQNALCSARNLFSSNSIQNHQASIRSPVRPVDSLNPSLASFCVRVRVTLKSHIITYHNNTGQGKFFKMSLSDDLGEICAIAFNEFCDQFFDSFQLYSVYYISNAKVSNKVNFAFTSVRNPFQLEFNERTIVELCNDGTDSGIPSHRFSFVALNIIPELQTNVLIDVIGIVRETFALKTGKKLENDVEEEWKKRTIRLTDSSNTSIVLNLWGNYADECADYCNSHPVLAIKGVRIGFFNESYQLSTVKNTSVLTFEPDIPVAESLRLWFAEQDRTDLNGSPIDYSRSLSSQLIDYGMSDHVAPLATIETLLQECNVEGSPKREYTLSGRIKQRKRTGDLIYKSCITHKKKLILDNEGNLTCPTCGLNTFTLCLLLSVLLTDGTGEIWVTLFNDTSEQLLTWSGVESATAESLANLKEQNETQYNEQLNEILNNSFVFKVSSGREFYNGRYVLQTHCKRLERMYPLTQPLG